MAEAQSVPAPSRDKDPVIIGENDDRSSLCSSGTQPGVKGIEAISQTWTTRSLVAAYTG